MSNYPFASYFEGRRQALCALGKAVSHSHLGLSGSARETLVRDFLLAHLPPLLAIGSGQVFGHQWAKGQKSDISTQQDVVIYRHDFPVLSLGEYPLYFRECVVSTIEVRTNYKSGELEELLDSATSVRKVQPVQMFTFQMREQGPIQRSSPRRILCGVFYFCGLKTRSPLVRELNRLIAKRAGHNGDLTDVQGPDFFLSAESGLIVRNHEFNTLFRSSNSVQGMDDVHGDLMEEEKQDGAYRRVFNDSEKWRGFLAVILELAERCQRYAVSYAGLTPYI